MNPKRKFSMVIFCIAIVTIWMCIFDSMNIAHEDENQYVNKFTDEEPSNELNTATTSMEITKLSDIYDGGSAIGVYVVGSYAYVADYDDGLEIIDISNPAAPVEVGQLYDGGYAHSVYVSGSYAYVADGTNGLEIIDISTPSAPIEVGQFDDGGWAYDVYVSGSYAYVADEANGLEIIDISNPSTPIEVGQFLDGGIAISVYVSGSYAYVADFTDGLEIIDISDPTTPTEVGQLYDGGWGYGVYVPGSYAYVADAGDGLEIIDISAPSTPTEVGQFDDGGKARGVHVSGSYVYVADDIDGLEIIDISDPTTPTEVGQFNDGGSAWDVYVSGSYTYVADWNDGLEILYTTEVNHIITVTEPTSSSSWEMGTSHSITWTSTGTISTVNIELYQNDIYVQDIVSGTANNGSYSWLVPIGLDYSTLYQIKIVDASDDTVYDFSEYFEMYTNTLIVTEPTSSSSWEVETSHSITWTSIGDIMLVDIELYQNDIYLQDIVSGTANDGSYSWFIPMELSDSTQYQIKITNTSDVTVFDFSEYFEIFNPTITVTDPTSSSSWETGTSYPITWTSTGDITLVDIEFYIEGVLLQTIVTDTANDGSFMWEIPSGSGNSELYQIKVVNATDPLIYDFSEYFEIFNPMITVTDPTELSSWETDTAHLITWTSTGTISTVNIELYKNGVLLQILIIETDNDGSYTWTIPAGLGDSMQYQIKIVDASDDTVYDFTDSFEIFTEETDKTIPGYNLILLISIIAGSTFILARKLWNGRGCSNH